MGRRHAGAALLVALGLVVVGCTDASDDAATTATTVAPDAQVGRALVDEGDPVPGGTLVVGVGADVGGYHPFASNWTTEGHLVGSTIFEPLMAYAEDGTVQPWLAESLTPDEDLSSWTIRLRPGITFHDGTPLDGAALARSMQSALTEGLGSIPFEGVVEDVEVVDDLTVTVHLTSSYAVFPEVLAGLTGYVAAPSMLDDPEGASHPVGTGPFELAEWRPNDSLRVTAYPEYWRTDDAGRQLPYLDEIDFRFVLDDQTRTNALTTGDYDLVLTTSTDGVLTGRDDPDLVTVEDSFSEETFVMLNTDRPPFDDPTAREALAYATDPETLVAVTQDGIATVATSPFAPGTDWEVEDPGWVTFDPARARAAAEAYEAEHGEPIRFRLSGIPTAETQDVLQVLQQQWADVGIEATIDTLEPTAYIVGVTFGDYEAAWFRSYSYHDPLYFYVFFHSRFANGPGTLSTNFSQVRDPELDALLEAGLATADVDERRDLNEQVVRSINEHQVDIWLFHTPYALVGRDVAGLNPVRSVGFANLEPKPWVGGLWRTEGDASTEQEDDG